MRACMWKSASSNVLCCICVSVWVHVCVFGDSFVSRIFHLRVIDINKKNSRQQLSKEVLSVASEVKKGK